MIMKLRCDLNEILPDEWFIKIFKDPDIIFSTNHSKIDWSIVSDFQVQGGFLIKFIKEIQGKIKNADDDYLYSASRQLYNTIECIRQIIGVNIGPAYMRAFETLFQQEFGDKKIYRKVYLTCFEKWIGKKVGQYQVGHNYYNILKGNLFYRDRFGQWFEIDKEHAFDLQPMKKRFLRDKKTIVLLNSTYKETPYDKIINLWNKKEFKGVLKSDFLKFNKKETSPEEYIKFTLKHIKKLIHNPVSIKELERWNGGEFDLEHLVKISVCLYDYISKKNNHDHTVYLLRDCLAFYELIKIRDMLTGEKTSIDQLMIGRKLLRSKHNRWGYWLIANEVFQHAYKVHPTNYDAFYNEYSRLMDMFVSLNPDFAKVVDSLAIYIKKHIRTDRKNIIFDIGFSGTITTLIKYIIDRHINQSNQNQKIEADMKLFAGASWFKPLFKNRHETDNFFLLHHTQNMAMSEHLYHYKPGSLKSGKLRATMGDKEWQHKAAVEFVVLAMVALLKQKK